MPENPEKPKKKRKYYRSPLDKLVSNSTFPAKTIAAKMGISYHRMVALRRIKEISKTDLELCKRAIKELTQGNALPLQELAQNTPQITPKEDSEGKVEVDSLENNVHHKLAAAAFLLGKTWGMLHGLTEMLAAREGLGQITAAQVAALEKEITHLFYSK